MKKREVDLRNKINEARFFMELINVIELSGKTLTHQKTTEEEVSYLLSAILNTFYSITEIAGGKDNKNVLDFRVNNMTIYGHSSNGGLRNTTVHVSHIGIDHAGNVPSSTFIFTQKPKLVIEEENLKPEKNVSKFNPNFYIKINDKLTDVFELCFSHLLVLEKFLKENNYI